MAIYRGGAKVTVYDNVIRSHFTGDGLVKREVDRVGRRAKGLAVAHAPSRTGTLKGSIRVTLNGAPGRYGASFTVYADTRYASWVEEGTAENGRGWIYPRTSRVLRLPRFSFGTFANARVGSIGKKNEASKGGVSNYVWAIAVHGQPGQHYLKRGVRDALRESGYGTFF